MITKDFNSGWFFNNKIIELPHDAMIHEKRDSSNPGDKNISYFKGGDYQYKKEFFVDEGLKDKQILFEFEGIYKDSEIYINNKKAGGKDYGYLNFYIEGNDFLKYNQINEMVVKVTNSDQPNSRWYTGSGIYRPVKMHILDKKRIELNGIKISTISHEPPIFNVSIKTNSDGPVIIEILDQDKILYKNRFECNGGLSQDIEIENIELWSGTNPKLYICRVKFFNDIVEEYFGVRTIKWEPDRGLLINGVRTILNGACIHHDNGILGACAYPEAEYRKVKILKENGYNAIRSAHNPCSKSLLKACDELGVYLMDEYVDMWYIHKTKYDYASKMEKNWKNDLKDMVNKNFNHPSVIIYSTGNEVSETAQKKGIELTGKMTDYLHSIDNTRPVTCGVNIFFNFLSSIGLGIYTDEKANNNNIKKKKPVGSEFYNTLATTFGDYTMKLGAAFIGSDLKTKDCYTKMDIAGYNYGILRYKKDYKKYPNRLIIGTETFCKDAYLFNRLVKKIPNLIGDFVWSGFDYIGEVGVGTIEYQDYAPPKGENHNWITAGNARIDITGRPTGEALYTKVALGSSLGPEIVVKPVYQTSKPSKSAWRLNHTIDSWAWQGCEGFPANIEVYSRSKFVELVLNGESIGKKRVNKRFIAKFKTKFKTGTLIAISYDKYGYEINKKVLSSGNNNCELRLIQEEEYTENDNLKFIKVRYTDSNGILKPMEKHRFSITVDGGKLLGLGHGCAYNPDGYTGNTTNTYLGEALAVVKKDSGKKCLVTAKDEFRTVSIQVY